MEGFRIPQSSVWCDGSGKKYTFYAELEFMDSNGKLQKRVIPKDDTVTLEIYNGVDDLLYCKGFMICEDTNGKLADAVGSQNSSLFVVIGMVEQQSNCSIVVEEFPQGSTINHLFLVENIQFIPSNGKNKMIQVNFTDWNQFYIMQCPNINTYQEDKETECMFKVVKNMISEIDPNNPNLVDEQSFKDIGDGKEIKLITGDNDTIATAFRKIMWMQFINDSIDDQLKFVFYDMMLDKFVAFQVGSNPMKPRGVFSVIISQEGTLAEKLMHPTALTIASPPSARKTRFMDMFSTYTVYSYNPESNQISNSQVKPASIIKIIGGEQGNRMQTDPKQSPVKTKKSVADWNADINIYSKLMDMFLNYDSLLLNESGNTARPLMSVMTITQDTTFGFARGDSTEQVKEALEKNKNIAGSWYITKVHIIFQPRQSKFSQNLRLSRLFNNEEE